MDTLTAPHWDQGYLRLLANWGLSLAGIEAVVDEQAGRGDE